MANYTTTSLEAVKYLCGLIRDLASVSEGIDDINLRSDGTFSSVMIDTLIKKCLEDSNEYTEKLVANLSRLELKLVTSESEITESNILYLFKPDGATSYNQYVVIEGNKVLLGTCDINMADYIKAADVAKDYATKVELKAVTDKIGTTTLTTTDTTITGAIEEVKGIAVSALGDKNFFSTAPIGTILSFAGQTAPHGYLLCDGASYKVADYPDLYEVIGNIYGGNTESFNIPNLVDKFIQGSTTSGEEKEAGLPNITGTFYHDPNVKFSLSGAFSYTSGSTINLQNDDANKTSGYVSFDASKSNAIYGNSDTVQPPALTMVYIIKAFHTNEGVDSGVSDDVINYIDNSNSYSTEETLTGGKWIDGKPIYRTYVSFPAFELKPYEWNIVNSLSITGIDEFINARAKRSEDNSIIPMAVRSSGTSIEVNPSTNFGISKLILEYTKQ